MSETMDRLNELLQELCQYSAAKVEASPEEYKSLQKGYLATKATIIKMFQDQLDKLDEQE